MGDFLLAIGDALKPYLQPWEIPTATGAILIALRNAPLEVLLEAAGHVEHCTQNVALFQFTEVP